jgi:hypothetical protein
MVPQPVASCDRAAAGNDTEAGGGLNLLTTDLNPLYRPVRPNFITVCSKLALHKFITLKVGIG